MRIKLSSFLLLVMASLLFFSCKKEAAESAGPKLIFKFKFDPSQERLNNIGQPSSMPAGHAGQSPAFNKMSAHYIELALLLLQRWEKV